MARSLMGNGFQPLVYGCLRFAAATAILGGIAYGQERTLALRRRDLGET